MSAASDFGNLERLTLAARAVWERSTTLRKTLKADPAIHGSIRHAPLLAQHESIVQEQSEADRQPVWLALSEFWLDTELDRSDHKRIAEVLAKSPYSVDELKGIERYEVAPVLWSNAISVAGEWAGWDPDFLNEACAENMAQGRGLIRRIRTALARRFVRFFTRTHWEEIETLIHDFRNVE